MANHPGTTREVFLAFLALGLSSFGGPVAHLGYFRAEFLARRKWLDDAAYADLVALCQFLPGPASSQVGIAIGKLRAGYPGALAAWVAFTMPSVALLLAFAYGAGRLSGSIAAGALHGLNIAALAVVALAVWNMARSLAPDWSRRIVALLAAALALLFPSGFTQLALIGIAGLAGLLLTPRGPPLPTPTAATGRSLWWLGLFVLFLLGLPLLAASGLPIFVIAEKFYRTGSLVFGGGHVVLPLLETELVRPGLIDRDLFLAGYGATQAVPGPLFAFAAYVGAMLKSPLNGILGATIGLVAIYLPSFFLVFGALPLWQRFRADKRLRGGLDLANAAVVGLLLAVLIDPVGRAAIAAPLDLVWAVAALLLLHLRWPPWAVVLLSAAFGAASGLL